MPVTVVAGVVVNVNGTAIAVATAIVVFVVLTAAITIAIAAAAAQPLLPLSLLVDCCLIEVLKMSLRVWPRAPRSGANETSDVVNINNSISGARGVDDDDDDNDDDDDDDDGDNDAINNSGGTATPER